MKKILIKIALVLLIIIPSLAFSNENNCNEFLDANFQSYLEINDKEFNSNGFMYFVQGEDGRCENGIGISDKDVFNECELWKNENGIIGNCEIYAKGKEVVWIYKEVKKINIEIPEFKKDKTKYSFDIVNLTKFNDDYFNDKVNYASSLMSNVNTQTIVLVYPLGRFKNFKLNSNNEVDFLGTVKVSHKMILKDWQIEEAISKIKDLYQNKIGCNDGGMDQFFLDIKWVLANGYASGLQSITCKNSRFIMMSIDPDKKKNNNKDLDLLFFNGAFCYSTLVKYTRETNTFPETSCKTSCRLFDFLVIS